MVKKYVPSSSELNNIENNIYEILHDVPETEVRDILERALEGRLRATDLDVDMSESEEEEEEENNNYSDSSSEEEDNFN